MLFHKVLPCLVFAVLASCAAAQLPTRPAFAHESSDLKADPAVRFGTLGNGLRYAILANKEPKERASLRLVVLGGSLHEADDQRGLAHFLEHMAFNGSTHFAPGTLIEFLQRMGMGFGADTNAYTSFDHTAYLLELPDTKPATLDESLKVFHDYAAGLLLLDKEIDRERGIILSEKRSRDSVEWRQFVAEFEFVLGSTRLPARLPIGVAAVIEQATRARFTEFYDAWYRPERMALVAVGDFDSADVEKKIIAGFGDLKGRGEEPGSPDLGQLATFEGLRTKHHHEPEAGATTVSIQIARPYQPEPDTAATRLKYVPRSLALEMINRRLSILAKKENAPFSRGSVSAGDQLKFVHNASIELVCKPEQWREALTLAEQELRRALEHGFQPAELREAVANEVNALEQAVKTAPTRRSEGLAGNLVSALVGNEVFTTPADNLALYKPALEKATPDDCAKALREAFAAPGRYVSVMGNAKVDATPEAAIAEAYTKSSQVAVQPPEKLADAEFAYTKFGPPGKVAARNEVKDLDLTLLQFENGVRLNFKKTDFEANQIAIALRIGTGQLTEPRDTPGLAYFVNNTFTAGGLGQHSSDDLKRLMAGKTVGVGFGVASDALSLRGLTNREDLRLQFQLLAAFVTDPGYRPEALWRVQKRIDEFYTKLDRTPEGPIQAELPKLLAGGDPRFGVPPKAAFAQRSLEEARAWLTPQLAAGAIEIAVVGDFDPAALIAAVAETFGALPKREPKPVLEEARKIAKPPSFTREFTVKTEIPKGIVGVYWPTTDARNVQVARRLRMLADVFTDRLRLKIREELGDAYSPAAGSSLSDVYRDYGHLYTRITVDPEKANRVVESVLTIAAELQSRGITEDELNRVRQPVLTMLRESSRTNSYWLDAVLASAQEQPERLDWSRTRYTDNEAITKAEIDALARQYLDPARIYRVTVMPEKR